MRITPHDAWSMTEADYEKGNRQAEVAAYMTKQLRGLPWCFDGSIHILHKEGYEPEVLIDNMSPQEAVALLARACQQIMEKHKNQGNREITNYPAELFADIAPADEWGFEEL